MFEHAVALCHDPISQLSTPEAVMADAYAREDAEYERLVRRWQRELERAQDRGDQLRIEDVQRTLRAAQLQRERQLADRVDYDDPPF